MNKSEMLAMIKKSGHGFLATVDNNKGRVRGMEIFRADENGIILYTSKSKDVFQQVARNPEVEMCFFVDGTQLRISGRLEIVEDAALKKEIVEARAFLKPVAEKLGYDFMGVMKLAKGKATTWSIPTMAEPKTYVDF
jgi:pyridoxamine 5'-phosphate oxidase